MGALTADFYARPVLQVARELIGCTLVHGDCAGVIVETEAYHEQEPASHAYGGLTPRTRTLFGPPGHAYVYLSYGMHQMINAVCEDDGVGAAVLIRALAPTRGLETMRARRAGASGRAVRDHELCSGPGKLTQALAIGPRDDGTDLSSGAITIEPGQHERLSAAIVSGTRIGITKAVELRWRFCVSGCRHVSAPRL